MVTAASPRALAVHLIGRAFEAVVADAYHKVTGQRPPRGLDATIAGLARHLSPEAAFRLRVLTGALSAIHARARPPVVGSGLVRR